MPKLFEAEPSARNSVRWALTALLFAAACGDHTRATAVELDSLDSSLRVGSIVVSPTPFNAKVGETRAFSAVVKDRYGRVVAAPITWTSSNNSVISITSSGGVATAAATGSATIRATSGGVSGAAQATIISAVLPVASVEIAPGTVNRYIYDTAQFSAIARDSTGTVIQGKTVTWTSSNTAIATVTSGGMGWSAGVGTAEVVGTIDGVSGRANMTVLAWPTDEPKVVTSVEVTPGTINRYIYDTAQFSAVVRDQSGAVMTGKTVTWTSTNAAIATVASGGLSRAVGVGSAQLVGTVDGVSGRGTLTVLAFPTDEPKPVASVSIAPGSVNVTSGTSTQMSATLRDSDGNVLTGRSVSWSSSNSQVAAVSSSGMVSANVPGSAMITATSEGVSATSGATVSPVSPAAVASVSIAPSSVSINTGVTTQLSATLRDANGNVLTGRSISWSSSNALVASVSNGGAVTGLVAGGATITAISEGVSGSASATVTLLPPPPSGSGSWPNMPSTYSVLTEQPFNPLQAVNWEIVWNQAGNGTVTSDPSSPFSSGSVFQVKYPAGFAGGTAPATQWTPLGGKRNVFVGMWWKPSAGWQGHASNVNKIQFVLPTEGGDMYMTAYGPPGGPFVLRVCLQFLNGDTRAWLVPNVSSGTVALGQWHRIEWLMEAGTGANGVVKWWLDGQLVGSYSDVLFPAGGMTEYKLSPTWGGMGDSKLQTDYYWFDHVTISSR